MHENSTGDNMLNELARTMTAGGRHSTAIALRQLAQAGYTSLEQVDNTSDWVLLAIPGIREGRLGEVRRLCRPHWQPPSSQAIRASNWFMSAARFALRHWPPETLASVLRGSATLTHNGELVDRRLALDVFAHAAEHARLYCRAEELVEAMWQVCGLTAPDTGLACVFSTAATERPEEPETGQVEARPLASAFAGAVDRDADLESEHFAHPHCKRIEIVRSYWLAREQREIQNKDAWARSHYQITGKTLLSYEREFQEHREAILAAADGK